jgi:putative ABC transport system permease protein
MLNMLGYAVNEIRKRKKSYVLNVLVISLVVVLLVTLNGLGAAYKDASLLPFENIHSSITIQRSGNVPENMTGAVLPCSLAPISAQNVKNISALSDVKGVSDGLFLWVFDKDNFKRVLGVDWNDSLGAKTGASLVAGSLPRNGTETLIEKAYAEKYGLNLNDTVNVAGTNFTIAGFAESSGKDIVSSDLYVGLPTAQSLAYNSTNLQKAEPFARDDVNIIFVDVDQTQVQSVANTLNSTLNAPSSGGTTPLGQSVGAVTIYTPQSFESQISSLTALSDQMILIISAIAFIGASLIVVKSMSHTILERRRELGVMKAVGFRNRDIQKEVLSETLLQGALGYALGIIFSAAAIVALSRVQIAITIPWELNPYPHFLLADPNSATVAQNYFLPITLQPVAALIALAVVAVISSVTALILTRYINRLKAAEVLKYE